MISPHEVFVPLLLIFKFASMRLHIYSPCGKAAGHSTIAASHYFPYKVSEIKR